MAVDGNPAALVDLSTVGAQVVSPTVLKPNQRVRVSFGDGKARGALQRLDCLGGVRDAEGPAALATAPASTSAPTPTPRVDVFAKKHKKVEK